MKNSALQTPVERMKTQITDHKKYLQVIYPTRALYTEYIKNFQIQQ